MRLQVAMEAYRRASYARAGLEAAIPWLEEVRDRVASKVFEDELKKSLGIDTDKARELHLKRTDIRRVGWWGVASKKFEPLYKAESRAVQKAIKGVSPGKIEAAAQGAIISLAPEWEKVVTAVLAVVIEDFGEDAAVSMGAGKGDSAYKWEFDPTSGAIQRYIREWGAKDVRSVLRTNLDAIRSAVSIGLRDNLGTPKIAMNLRQLYSDRSPYKAMRLARTEVGKASTYGSLSAARQSGFVKSKTWVSSKDDRVRDEHLAIDNDTVPLDLPFRNDLQGPEEPNCRCAVAFSSKPAPPSEGSNFVGQAWKNSLTDYEAAQMKGYQTQKYWTNIRQAQMSGKKMTAARQRELDAINSALDKAKPFKGTVFRGIGNMSDELFDSIVKQKTIRWQSLTSSSKKSSIAEGFMGRHAPGGRFGKGKAILFEIKTVSGVDLHHVTVPKFFVEQEVLIRTGTVYSVTGSESLGTDAIRIFLKEIVKEVVK